MSNDSFTVLHSIVLDSDEETGDQIRATVSEHKNGDAYLSFSKYYIGYDGEYYPTKGVTIKLTLYTANKIVKELLPILISKKEFNE